MGPALFCQKQNDNNGWEYQGGQSRETHVVIPRD